LLCLLVYFLNKLATATVRAQRKYCLSHSPAKGVIPYKVPLAGRAAKQEGGASAPPARGGRWEGIQKRDKL